MKTGTKNVNGKPHIDAIDPACALPGGEIRIVGSGLGPHELRRPRVSFGDVDGPVIISSEQFIVARVPDGAASGEVVVASNGSRSNPSEVRVAVPIAENLHPVANPAIDAHGDIYVTFSGSRGQKVPIAIYRIDNNYAIKPFLHEMMNATGLALDRAGSLYVSSRYDGTVYRVAQNGTMTSYAEGMGVATGIAFDRDGNLYVGDRSGTIFKIGRDRQIFVFATHRAQRLRLSSRLRQQWQSLRHRPNHVQLRRRSSNQPAWRGERVLSRPGSPAGNCRGH